MCTLKVEYEWLNRVMIYRLQAQGLESCFCFRFNTQSFHVVSNDDNWITIIFGKILAFNLELYMPKQMRFLQFAFTCHFLEFPSVRSSKFFTMH